MRPSILITALLAASGRLLAQDLVSNEMEKGYIKDGKKFSVWEYYTDQKELELKIDHTTGRVFYLKPDSSRFAIRKDSTWVMQSMRVYPIPVNGYQNLYKAVRDNLHYPTKALEQGLELEVYVMFDVDEQGHASDFVQLGKVGYGFEEEIAKAVNAMPLIWVAARVDGKPVRSRFILPLQFSIESQKLFESVILPPGRLLKPVSIVATAIARTSDSQFELLSRSKLPLVWGTIIRKSGDSVNCFIELAPDFDTKVVYKKSQEEKETSMPITEIDGLKFQDAEYRTMEIEGKENLLKVLASGKVGLFKYVKRDLATGALDMSFVLTRGTSRYLITQKNFDALLPELLRDNFKIYDRLQLRPFSFHDVPDIVSEYSGGAAREKTQRKPQIGEMTGSSYELIEGDTVWTIVDVQPEFNGGYEGMMNFIRKTMRYPASARRMGIDGIVITTFIIESDGAISHVQIVRGISGDCDQESARVVSLMPKWKPGLRNGKAVRTRFNLPIKYKLN